MKKGAFLGTQGILPGRKYLHLQHSQMLSNTRMKILQEEDDDAVDERGRKVGTRRRRAFYTNNLPRPLNAPPGPTSYLYQVLFVYSCGFVVTNHCDWIQV